MPALTSVLRSPLPCTFLSSVSIARARRSVARFGVVAIRLVAAGLVMPAALAAQVGHLPANSPFEDVKLGQNLSIMGGWMAMTRDPADVAPLSSLAAALRYDIGIGGPASLYARYVIAPSERKLLQPTNPLAKRVIGTPGVTTHQLDAGLDLALTGKKTWHRLIPSLNGGVGVVTDFAAADTGAYRFGTKFSFDYGASLRVTTGSRHELHVDLSRATWKYNYPDSYGGSGAASDSSILGARDRSGWTGSTVLQIGISRFFLR